MPDNMQNEILKELLELDTGKAQPLFHPYPIINIFREDEPLTVKKIEKKDDEKLLKDMAGVLCDVSETVKSQISIQLEIEGAKLVSESNTRIDDVEEEDESKSEVADFTIAMDPDASFLKFAILQGCPALKATYGLVSRYGMDTDAPSLAQPAIGAQSVSVIAKVLQAIAGVDNKDPMSRDAYIYEYMEALKNTDMTGMKIAVPEKLSGMELGEMQIACYNQMLDVMEAKGAEIETVDLEWISYAVSVHEMIAAAEKVMTADEISMSLMEEDEMLQFGAFLLEEDNYETYYLKALKLRSLIKDSYDMLFRNYALFVVPYTEAVDPYSVVANLAGLPAMTMPYVPYGAETADGTVVTAGIHMIAGANYENHLIKVAYAYEQEVL